MYLGLIDYIVLILLLVLSCGTGIYQGYSRSKQISSKQFLIADGRMKIIPTAMSLLATLKSAASLLGMPVEFYYYGTMLIYCIFPWFIGTYLTVNFFIPKYHYIGSASIYAYLEQRFSLTIRILVTCSFVLVTILSMAVILYGPSLALSQVTGLNIWIAVGLCGIICTIYTSIGGMKAVIWTDVIQASIMFIGLILSIIIGVIDAGGIFKVYESLKAGNRLQFSVVDFDPSIRYTMWSIFIGVIFSSTAQYACIQTQAQRYMCVKDTKSAQKVAWTNYVMLVFMHILCLCVGCLLYNKYSQCDPLQAKIISRSDQMYPLFVIETLGRIPGFTGVFIACMLSATLSTFSSGVNSMATVILEDIYKPLTKKHSMSNEEQVTFSKMLSVCIGCLSVIMSFLVSFMKSNIITLIIQIFGVFAAPILGIYFLGLFSSRVKSRSVFVAFFLCLIFQLFMLFGSIFTTRPANKQGGRLPISIAGCLISTNVTTKTITYAKSNFLVSLFSISPLWFIFIGTMTTIILGMIFSFILDSKDTKIIDPLLLVSTNDIFPCLSSKKTMTKQSIERQDDNKIEEEIML
ncbi:unnamed protein product [Adineta steineri]|uniref:Uncharacterized protein n=1 Tax=Adineta steineri TaxID=433720 RepID=A0A814QA85_9BILA|nr:unnamed protein product [Adineta steineri]CAF4106285.1 unnamed protein product [Adineta steineri]